MAIEFGITGIIAVTKTDANNRGFNQRNLPMELTEFAVAAFFIAAALFGVVDAIRTPLIVKRLYRDKGFTDAGKTVLSEYSAARILDSMYTEHLNQKTDTGPYKISQCKAWSVDRRKFTFSKAVRKRNRAAWSITIVQGDFAQLDCLMLPTVVPEAIAYVGNGEDIDFGDDVEVANRYHITTANEALVKSAARDEIRAFLLQPDVIFIESTNNQLVIKRNWVDHLILNRLEQELSIAANLKERLGS